MKQILYSVLLLLGLIVSPNVFAVYDLALKKTTLNHGPYEVGDVVQFDIEVFNQGDEDARDITIGEYLIPELELADITWQRSGDIETGFFAEYTFDSIPAGESRSKNIFYRVTDDSDSHIVSNTEIFIDDGDDCDSTPDNNILNDGILFDDYLGTGCESDTEFGEDDADSVLITVKDRKKSIWDFIVISSAQGGSYISVKKNYYIPVSTASEYINVPEEEPIIEIPLEIIIQDYDFRQNEIQELEDFSGNLSEGYDVKNNEKLIAFGEESNGDFISVSGDDGNISFYNTLINIAQSIKNLFYAIAGVFFLIITLRLLFASNTDEELGKFKKGVIWITVGLIVMQIALSFVTISFDQGVSAEVGENILSIIVQPLILLIQTLASIFFIAIALFAFYRLVTANGNEEAVKSGKMSIVYAILGFMIVRFAGTLVNAFYGQIDCDPNSTGTLVATSEKICRNEADFSQGVNIIMSILTWINSFVALAVIIMIIYAGAQILLSGGDEEKVKKGKQSLIYIAIGVAVLAINYVILTFFLVPDTLVTNLVF